MRLRQWRALHPPCGRTIGDEDDLRHISMGVAIHAGVADPLAFLRHRHHFARQ